MMEAGRIVVRAEGNMVSDMNGEKVMFSTRTGKYYNLGSVGGRIWDLIAAPVVIGQVVDALAAEYEVDREDCEWEVGAFLRQMYRESLIEVRSF
ncbi:lasso peptide biosynthesis PqqD family chaperone [Cohnella nanjingensis]|uniref:Lasso peptide biosynthesis PqqD family chaperone n=2 Tax=Cohnella nanjingensis TaxID=1387779 RepID=A0A7X0RQ80_9BACL|nr:lasso peptide biosynthesis PqqD family chaperone [Cohnella nanjingensis]